MKQEIRELLGFNVPIVGIVETLPEAIAAAGSEDAVLKDYNSNVLAHSHYTIARRAIVKKLEELTGIKRLVKEKDNKVEKDETEGVYIAKLEDQLGEAFRAPYAADIAAVVKNIPVDYKPGTRGSGEGSKPAAKWLAYYDQLVKESKLDAFCQKHSIDQTVSEDDLKIAVANKVKEIVTARLAEAAAQAMAV